VEGGTFDEAEFFRAIDASGARVLLIGRRALVAYGLPVLTADYDLWIDADDAGVLNRALSPLGLLPTRTPEDACAAGRYVLENDEHVDVLVARGRATTDGVRLSFADAWGRRNVLRYGESATIAVPCLDDLILTKRWARREKDVADVRLLEALKARRGGGA
jgi:hypothetical protein